MAHRTCSIPGCDLKHRGRGYCNRHLLRLRRHGDPLAGRPSWDDFTIPTEKACTRCGEIKPLELFATRSAARDGKSPWCKSCFTQHYYAHPESKGVYRKRHREANPGYFREYYRANREKRIAQAAAYAKAHRMERKAWEERYRVENRDRLNAVSAAYQRRTGHKYSKARMLAKRTRVVDVVDRRVVFERGMGLCGICGDPVEIETFHIDHIIPLARGGEHSYANTQPAHPTCNLRKGARLVA